MARGESKGGQVMTDRLNVIPDEVLSEISFMLGSIEECNSDYLKPIIERHGYSLESDGFLMIEPEDDVELTLDIYNTLFITGIVTPFN